MGATLGTLREERCRGDTEGASPLPPHGGSVLDREKHGADAGSCGMKGVGGQLLPGAAVFLHDGPKLGALPWSVGAESDEAAARCETTERMGDVLDIVAVLKRRIHDDARELPKPKALQKVSLQHVPADALRSIRGRRNGVGEHVAKPMVQLHGEDARGRLRLGDRFAEHAGSGTRL